MCWVGSISNRRKYSEIGKSAVFLPGTAQDSLLLFPAQVIPFSIWKKKAQLQPLENTSKKPHLKLMEGNSSLTSREELKVS